MRGAAASHKRKQLFAPAMAACQVKALSVVHRANIHNLAGSVTLKDVLALYGVGSSEKA
jgi:hypothetical protein